LTREKWWARLFFSYAPQSHHQSGVLEARIDGLPKPFRAALAPSRWCFDKLAAMLPKLPRRKIFQSDRRLVQNILHERRLPVEGVEGQWRGACIKLPQVVTRRSQASQNKEIGEFQRRWRRSWRYDRCRGRPTAHGHERCLNQS
jgi:hypothetical protein